MAGSTFGTILRMTTWGESHGPALGVTVDGCPAGLELCEADVQEYLDRRSRGRENIPPRETRAIRWRSCLECLRGKRQEPRFP